MTAAGGGSSDDEEEEDLVTPLMLRKGSRISTSSMTSSSVVIGNISEEFLRVWSTLPENIRLDPSVASFQRQYEKKQERDAGPGTSKTDCFVVKMSLKHHPFSDSCQNEQCTHEKLNSHERKLGPVARYIKLTWLSICWIVFSIALVITPERTEKAYQVTVLNDDIRNLILLDSIDSNLIGLSIESSMLSSLNVRHNKSLPRYYLSVWLEYTDEETTYSSSENKSHNQFATPKNISEIWNIPLVPPDLATVYYKASLLNNHKVDKIFQLEKNSNRLDQPSLELNMKTNLNTATSFLIKYDTSPIDTRMGTLYGAFVLIGLYGLIIFEIVHRAIAAMLASTSAIGVLAALNQKPSMAEIMSWIDIDTLLLLFSMMILVAVVADTGVFDYLAVYAYKITGGRVWPLMSTLWLFSMFASLFLDNVTTVLLMTPVTIRLCEVMQLNPVPVLTAMVIFSNIGGAMTPIGDPPNVIIASNRDVVRAGVDFRSFTAHMSIGVILVALVVYGHFRFFFRDLRVLSFDEPQDVQELRHEIAIWQRAAASLSSYSKDENLVRETLMKKIQRLLQQLKQKMVTGNIFTENYKATLEELQEKYPIRNKLLLVKSGFAMILVIILFFLHSVPNFHLSLGWTAFLCVLLLLVIADSEDLDGLMARVEWSTLLFFAALFVLMEAVSRLGLITWIGAKTELIIMSVSEESKLAVAILLLLWVSAIAGAFVDNVPLATMMVRIATGLSQNPNLQLSLQPLVWALAFGSCLGGNGTLIGATANVVCAGVAEQHGYRFTFVQFFKMGFPVLISSTMTVTIYLMIAHVVLDWNY